MAIGRWRAILLCLASALAIGSSGPVLGQTAPPDIVINGLTERQASAWKRSESAHVVIFSKGSDAELVRVSRNIERLYQLMSRLYRRGGQSDDAVKPQITLLDSADDVAAMALTDLRSQEGPYHANFGRQPYYDPREDGAVLAIARRDQNIELNTNRAYNLDCDDALSEGAKQCFGSVPYHWPAVRTWEEALYGAYARHFILTYRPAAYPRWYLDGIAALFSTIRVRGDGRVDYAREPEAYRQVFRSYGYLHVGDVLAGRYLGAASKQFSWTPDHAWLLAHFFLFSDLKAERGRQFQRYMTAIHQGRSMAEAAAAFGDPARLQRDIRSYADAVKSFARTAPAKEPVDDPVITAMSASNGALTEARVELGSRLALFAGSAPDAERGRAWLAALRLAVARMPYDRDAWLFAAEADCRGAQPADCLTDADRVLDRYPDSARALAWKGVALTDLALAGPAADRAARLALARKTILQAIALDDEAPMLRIAYFQSFTKAGERAPDDAMAGMARVIRAVPAAPAPRLYLAAELLRQGKPDLARRVADMLLNGPYDSPEKTMATALFGAPASVPAAGR